MKLVCKNIQLEEVLSCKWDTLNDKQNTTLKSDTSFLLWGDLALILGMHWQKHGEKA